MTYIDLAGIDLTIEMKQWINREAEYFSWKLGDRPPRNGIWKLQRERLGVYLNDHDAIIFKLKFGLIEIKKEDL